MLCLNAKERGAYDWGENFSSKQEKQGGNWERERQVELRFLPMN